MTDTPSPARYAIGDLGPARRHIARLIDGQLPASHGIFLEIAAALDRCVLRLEGMDMLPEADVSPNTERLDPVFLANYPLPWTMGNGVLLDAEGRDVPMYAEEMLFFVLAKSKE